MLKVIRLPAYTYEGHNFPNTTYLQVFKTRFVWHDGTYSGHYKFA